MKGTIESSFVRNPRVRQTFAFPKFADPGRCFGKPVCKVSGVLQAGPEHLSGSEILRGKMQAVQSRLPGGLREPQIPIHRTSDAAANPGRETLERSGQARMRSNPPRPYCKTRHEAETRHHRS